MTKQELKYKGALRKIHFRLLGIDDADLTLAEKQIKKILFDVLEGLEVETNGSHCTEHCKPEWDEHTEFCISGKGYR